MVETWVLLIVLVGLMFLMHRRHGGGFGCCGGHAHSGHKHDRSKPEPDEKTESRHPH